MRSRLAAYWRNTGDMPFVLRMLCQGAMVAGPLGLLMLVVPLIDVSVNGQRLSYAELWTSGAGLSGLMFAGLVTIWGWGMAARKPWSRWTLVAAPLLPILPFPKELIPDLRGVIVSGIVHAAIAYVLLFHLRSVREYLERGNREGTAA